MAETATLLLQILERITDSQTRLTESLQHLEDRHNEHMTALANILDRMDARLERMDERHTTSNQYLADILRYIAETTSRTEQMTARVLTELTKGVAH